MDQPTLKSLNTLFSQEGRELVCKALFHYIYHVGVNCPEAGMAQDLILDIFTDWDDAEWLSMAGYVESPEAAMEARKRHYARAVERLAPKMKEELLCDPADES